MKNPGLYDTVSAGWSGQQVPGRKFERPDTGLDDETVLKKKKPENKSLIQFPDMPNDKKLKAATISSKEESITEIGRHKKPSHKSLL